MKRILKRYIASFRPTFNIRHCLRVFENDGRKKKRTEKLQEHTLEYLLVKSAIKLYPQSHKSVCVSSGESHISMPTLRLIINRLHIPLKLPLKLFLSNRSSSTRNKHASETPLKRVLKHVKRQKSFHSHPPTEA